MNADTQTEFGINGPVRRWRDDHRIYWAENDWLRLAWARTDDPAKVGRLGFHGPEQVCVEYISPTTSLEFDQRWASPSAVLAEPNQQKTEGV